VDNEFINFKSIIQLHQLKLLLIKVKIGSILRGISWLTQKQDSSCEILILYTFNKVGIAHIRYKCDFWVAKEWKLAVDASGLVYGFAYLFDGGTSPVHAYCCFIEGVGCSSKYQEI
jgi:hypothetical protein